MADVSISGTNAVLNGLDDLLANVQAEVDKLVQSAGLMCEAEAKTNCPVDTGNLKASIHYENTGPMSCSVGTAVEYAPYVELGTYKMRAQPYLFPAFQKATATLQDALNNL